MIYEKLEGFQVDVEKLTAHLHNEVIPYGTPIMQGDTFGGWSILSATGTYDDGWQQGHTCYSEVDGKLVFDHEKAKAIGLTDNLNYKIRTPICVGYLAKVMDRIEELKLYPRRARISLLKAKGFTDWHYDADPGKYAVRLHIPLVTNPRAEFRTQDEGGAHMPADGSAYFVRVDRLHQAVNEGDEDRYHIIMQVWDTEHVSRYHRYRRDS